jgi:hypothetical protein
MKRERVPGKGQGSGLLRAGCGSQAEAALVGLGTYAVPHGQFSPRLFKPSI